MGGPDGTAGDYAYLRWNRSTSSCVTQDSQASCTYGSNHEAVSSAVRCGGNVTLSWDLKDWIHGSMAVSTTDPAGMQVDSRTLSSTSHGAKAPFGPAGAWTLRGQTNDANGDLEVRLTCN